MLFRSLGVLILLSSLVADYTYAFKQTFSSKALFVAYLGLLGIRCVLPVLLACKSVCNKVQNKERNALPANAYRENEDPDTMYSKQQEHTKNGQILYVFLPLSYFTGYYRLLDFKNFPSEIGTGLALDFALNALPLLFIQTINNATLS